MLGKWHHADHKNWEGRARKAGRSWYRRPKYNVPVNIIEHPDKFEVQVFALTYPKDGIKVSVMDDTLYLTGSRSPKEDHPNFLLQEYPIKSFERSFELTHRVDQNNIKATFKEGVLTVHVAKAQEAMEPEISIEVE
ncbi:MAG: Hsp20/alpha crystallin family protein [Bacteroidota bacterium]